MTQDSSDSAAEDYAIMHHSMSRGHGVNRTFYCENCPQTFKESLHLQDHIRNDHPGARPFPCIDCGKTFATSSGLKQHHHIHSSVKPFQCEVCLKAYTQFSNLCRHKRMHADCRQQIKCRGCGQCFSTMHSLNKHKRYCDRMMHGGSNSSPLDVPSMVGSNHRTPLTVDTSTPTSLSHNIRHIYNTPSITPRFPYMPTMGASLPIPSPFPMGMWMPSVFPGMPAAPCDINLHKTNFLQQKLEERTMHSTRDKLSDLGSSPTSDLGRSDEDQSVSPASERRPSLSSDDHRIPSPSSQHHSTSPPLYKGFSGVPSIPITPMLGLRGSSSHIKSVHDNGKINIEKSISPKNNASEIIEKKSRPVSVVSEKCSESIKKDIVCEAPLDLTVCKKEEVEECQKTPVSRSGSSSGSEYGGSREPSPKPIEIKPVSPPMKSPMSDDYEKSYLFPHKSFLPTSPLHWPNPMALLHLQELERLQYLHKMSQHYMSMSMPQRSPPTSNGLVRPMPIPAMSPPNRLDHSAAFPSVFPVRSPPSGLPYNGGYMRTGKDKYVCKFCGKVFPRSANLTRHLRTHTGEQPYKCKYCDRSFSISSNLQRHIRNIHNKEKPFRCNVCDRSFGQQTNLDRHLRKHETEGVLNGKIIDSPLSDHIDDEDEDIKIDVDDCDDFEDNESHNESHNESRNSVCDEVDRWSYASEERDRSCYSPSEIPSNGHIDTNFSITAQIEKQKHLTIEAH